MDIENPEEWTVRVGRVSSTWDKALVKVQSFSDNPDRFAAGVLLRVGPAKKPLNVITSRKSGHAFILDCGLRTTQEATALIGLDLFVHPSMRPALPPGEFYVDEMLGLRAVTEEGEELGVIEEVLDTPAHDIYVTPLAMIPSVDRFIVHRDFANKTVTVRDCPGLRINEQ